MQLSRREPLPRSTDLASGLRAAAQRAGHRPALTVLTPRRREEQGFASLAQWAAKGAHLLEVDLALGPGGLVQVSGPPGWMPAAACLATWWVGATVVVGTSTEAAVAVNHESLPASAAQVLWFGDEVDGSPTDPDCEPAYAVEVQAFPDQPPPPHASGELVALRADTGLWTQSELIDVARDRWGVDGVLGLEVTEDLAPDVWVTAVAARPIATGKPTVVVAGVEREAAAAERVDLWVDAGQGA